MNEEDREAERRDAEYLAATRVAARSAPIANDDVLKGAIAMREIFARWLIAYENGLALNRDTQGANAVRVLLEEVDDNQNRLVHAALREANDKPKPNEDEEK